MDHLNDHHLQQLFVKRLSFQIRLVTYQLFIIPNSPRDLLIIYIGHRSAFPNTPTRDPPRKHCTMLPQSP